MNPRVPWRILLPFVALVAIGALLARAVGFGGLVRSLWLDC